jgi:hypothetical protein
MNDKQEKFIIHRVLIRQILLTLINSISNKVTERNFKHLASVVYYIACGMLQKLIKNEGLGDGVRGGVYSRKEMIG